MGSEERSSAMSHKISSPSHSNSSSSSKHDSRQDSWEIVEGLRGGHSNVQEPQKQDGYMLKRRKWPMKGWHKRYFYLDKGILKYAKCGADVSTKICCPSVPILSARTLINHTQLSQKAHQTDFLSYSISDFLSYSISDFLSYSISDFLSYSISDFLSYSISDFLSYSISDFLSYSISDFLSYSISDFLSYSISDFLSFSFFGGPIRHVSLARQASVHAAGSFPVTCTSQSKVAAWLQSSDHMNKCSKDMSVCESYLLELNHLLQSMEVIHRTYSAPAINALLQASTFDTPKKEKRPPRKWRGSKNYGKDVKTTLQVPSCISSGSVRLHAPTPTSLLQPWGLQGIMGLKNALSSAIAQNSELRERLSNIHAESSCVPEPSTGLINFSGPLQKQDSTDGSHPLVHQASNESRASITESLSEFFDAQEVLLSASSSENEASDDDSYISDNVSDNISMDNFSNETERPNSGCEENGALLRRRRSCLPSASPNTSNISLWNILKNNIGKDLSKVAMPVQLNEPLNTLQRLCEELEYSELLDRAADTQDPFERMVYIATFAVSGYASSYHRAGGKPFNPVLGETYECDRPDKGLRFVAEQVSHHPPISACHADSKNYIFWQDIRWKNKFWGKSMEIVPVGTTHVMLPGFGDHYEWNKVTSCIHNILSGQRWIEHYGEISIRNTSTDICQCKVTFIKAKYWNSSVNEVEGTITDHKGKVIHRLFGKWNEGVYCGDPPSATCIWRANAMPADHEQYYGFTKFAMELNELDPSLKLLLPPTDTRLRLDQRLLEEGNVEAAEEQKQKIEQQQRDRRRVLEENTMTHQPTFFRKSKDDTWVSNNTYWDLRRDPGFSHLDCPVLW
uniref:oxysterol-binding protein-related protein 3-like n=1 Tax=Oncorhynchus gorbuscha TaxID=8017 RepID=UPI001EAEBB33|nr:oxysterol-binding protein-related protein 3-like [Oncorhynchus gorbuscha]